MDPNSCDIMLKIRQILILGKTNVKGKNKTKNMANLQKKMYISFVNRQKQK